MWVRAEGERDAETPVERIGDSDICRVLNRHDVPGLGYRTESEIKGVLGAVGDMDLLGLRGQAEGPVTAGDYLPQQRRSGWCVAV